MKPFVMLKMPMLLCGLGAVLLLSPACRAQSEISPDHFDGTDSWETALKTSAPKARQKPASLQAQSRQTNLPATMQLASAREVSKPAPPDAVAIQDKRKPAPRKSNKP